jgi:GTP-binding protein EngB required for normal cell division
MEEQQKILNDLMSQYINNKDEINLSDVIDIKKTIEQSNNKYFLIEKNKYELIISKINKIEEDNKNLQLILMSVVNNLNKLVNNNM